MMKDRKVVMNGGLRVFRLLLRETQVCVFTVLFFCRDAYLRLCTVYFFHHQKPTLHHLDFSLSGIYGSFIYFNMMNKLWNKLNNLLRHQDFLAFAGLWLWVGIFYTLAQKTYTWEQYLSILFVLAIIQLPVLVFAWYKDHFKATLSKKRYLGYWVLCFFVCLPILTVCCSLWEPMGYGSFLFAVALIWIYLLELLLIANSYYYNRVQHIKWVKKIGLEKAVLISIMLIAVTLAAMAVSSMHNPAYNKGKERLIGIEFDPWQIITHFGTFLSFGAQFLLMYLCGYLFFLINSRLLVSKVLKQKGLLMYALSLLATIGFLYPIMGQLLILLPINETFGRIFSGNPFALENAFGALAIMLVSLPIVLSIQWAKQNTQIVSLEKEKTQTELDLLKQQLNPHFFFNTLNNLYALSLQKSDKTPESILQLSELMRYVIYKGQEKAALLTQEIKYIEDYIQLQQMRLKIPLQFSFEQEINNEDVAIAPLLLIVLVENAFKHGIEPAEDATILKLRLTCNGKQLHFSCQNSFEENDIVKTGGIGLQNLKRRLELLYPGTHTLKTVAENHIFKATLQLNLV